MFKYLFPFLVIITSGCNNPNSVSERIDDVDTKIDSQSNIEIKLFERTDREDLTYRE